MGNAQTQGMGRMLEQLEDRERQREKLGEAPLSRHGQRSNAVMPAGFSFKSIQDVNEVELNMVIKRIERRAFRQEKDGGGPLVVQIRRDIAANLVAGYLDHRAKASEAIDKERLWRQKWNLLKKAVGRAGSSAGMRLRLFELQEENDQLKNDAWQPIETAPRNNKLIMVYGSGGCYVNRVDELGNVRNRLGRIMDSATHWRPLPAPPSKGETDGT